MNYEKLVREWVAHYGGVVFPYDDEPGTIHVDLPDGLSWSDWDATGDFDGWEAAYNDLIGAVYLDPVLVGPVPGGAR